jgi:hypothetical protein
LEQQVRKEVTQKGGIPWEESEKEKLQEGIHGET